MPRLAVSRSVAFDTLSAGAQFRDQIAIVVHAAAPAIFRALFQVSLEDMRLAWWLGAIRYLPARLIGRAPPADARRPFMETLIDGGTLVLRDDRPTEIVTGSAGRLHRIVDQAPVLFPDRAAFDTLDDPDHEKLFMSIRVAPTGAPGEQWLVLEHATRALSPDAARKFRRYWIVIRPMGAFNASAPGSRWPEGRTRSLTPTWHRHAVERGTSYARLASAGARNRRKVLMPSRESISIAASAPS